MERTRKIKHLWALANSLWGKEKEKYIYDSITFCYGKERLRELTDEEIDDTIKMLRKMEAEYKCPKAPAEWIKIKQLQRKYKITDEHLRNFIKKVTGVSHERFLDFYTARAVISALYKKYSKKIKEGI